LDHRHIARNFGVVMDLKSVSPSAVRSVRQQDFLKGWFRIFNRTGQLLSLSRFEPSRIDDEKPELMYYDVARTPGDIRYPVTFAGSRLIEAYGFTAVGRDIQDILSPSIWAHVEPLYDQCVIRAMPIYSVFTVLDLHDDVAYERLLLPFGEADVVQQMIASIKSISVEGRFVNVDLMRSKDQDPRYSLRAVVHQGVSPDTKSVWADDVVEIRLAAEVALQLYRPATKEEWQADQESGKVQTSSVAMPSRSFLIGT
jgi:hypothetical protein